MSNYRSLSPTYYDPEAEPVPPRTPNPEPEPEPVPEPKKRGRTPGSKNKPKPPAKPKRNIPWYNIFRGVLWSAAFIFTNVALFLGVKLTLSVGVAYVIVAVTTLASVIVLDRGWKRMRL